MTCADGVYRYSKGFSERDLPMDGALLQESLMGSISNGESLSSGDLKVRLYDKGR